MSAKSVFIALFLFYFRKGARLTHDHNRQYQFALQTLTLWREIQNDMFKLWCLAEDDLLDADNYYSLRDTGQVSKQMQQHWEYKGKFGTDISQGKSLEKA